MKHSVLLIAALFSPAFPGLAKAEKANVVIIFADDKYESAGPEAENLRKNRQNAGFSIASGIDKGTLLEF